MSYAYASLMWWVCHAQAWSFDPHTYQPRLLSQAPVEIWKRTTRNTRSQTHSLFVRADSLKDAQVLQNLGVSCGVGQWCFQTWDSAFLTSVVGSGLGVHVRMAPAHKTLLMESTAEVGAAAVHEGWGVDLARQGRGVLVGIVDTGIDLSHNAFKNAQGVSRVVAVWDQDATQGKSPEAFRYGAECTLADIRAEKCTLTDPVGHGTHVSGIAAGSGRIPGMAPQADIAVVRSRDFTRLADAVEYLTYLAQQREQPVVINVSVGGQYGPHDGKTPLEEYLSYLTGAGRILVAAAGNDGADSVHVGGYLTPTGVRMSVEGLSYVGADTLLEFWVSQNSTLGMAVEIWVGAQSIAAVDVVAGENETVSTALRYKGEVLLDISYGAEKERSGSMVRHALVFSPQAIDQWPAGAMMVVKLYGQGFVDGWVSQSDYVHGQARFGPGLGPGWFAGDGRRSITIPATSPNIVAVGSYTLRNTWSQGPLTEWLSGAPIGMLAPYSSVGPTPFPRSTGWKPDVCAPGSVIASARARSVFLSNPSLSAEETFMQGTSMAAPHVTGVVALMLETNPTLTPSQVRHVLQESARSDVYTGSTPNAQWGFGKLNAEKAISILEGQTKEGCSQTGYAPAVWIWVLGIRVLRSCLKNKKNRTENKKIQ